MAAAAVAVLSAVGCAKPGPVFAPLASPLLWPAPPETPRIEYVGELQTSSDLKRPRNLGQAIGEGIFGRAAAHSMLSPWGLCTDGGERLFVADSNAQVVHVFDLGTRRYQKWRPDPKSAPFAQPLGIAWDPRERLLVADPVAGVVFVFDTRGRSLGSFGSGLLSRPCGVAVDRETGRRFVADAGSHEVLVFDPEGRLLKRLGGRGSDPGRFNYPTAVALDGAGRLYVSDTLNFRIQVFDRELAPLYQVGRHGDLPGDFSQPKGLALDSEGHLYVVDAHFENVQVFDGQGRLLLAFGHEGRGPAEFWLPAGIHIDASDRIWIADLYNRRVQVFRYLKESP